jgi:hypothetical protein
MNTEIQMFLQRHGIELAIEPVDENPMGPPHWQAHFIHYALWITSTASWRGIPLYASFYRPFVEGGPYAAAEALAPSPAFLLAGMAKTLYAHSLGLEGFARVLSAPDDPAGVQFYFDSISAKLPDLRILLGEDGLAELIQVGGAL